MQEFLPCQSIWEEKTTKVIGSHLLLNRSGKACTLKWRKLQFKSNEFVKDVRNLLKFNINFPISKWILIISIAFFSDYFSSENSIPKALKLILKFLKFLYGIFSLNPWSLFLIEKQIWIEWFRFFIKLQNLREKVKK